MAATLNPQEIFLLERYSSLAYFEPLRDDFAALVKTTELALAEFMAHLPPDYRAKPLWMQPDIVWGQRVLPNIRATLGGLNSGYVSLTQDDFTALSGGSVGNDFIAIMRDYPIDWMPEARQLEWEHYQREAWRRASNMDHTQQCTWLAGSLTTRYSEDERGPLDPPASWPIYRVNESVKVRTTELIQRTGVYLPDVAAGCAQFLAAGNHGPDAHVAIPRDDPARAGHRTKWLPATWTLVERVADSGGGTPGATDPFAAGIRLRCEAGHPCPQAGWWFTPASADSRRHFQHGQVMPDSHSSYGATIWQWDERQ